MILQAQKKEIFTSTLQQKNIDDTIEPFGMIVINMEDKNKKQRTKCEIYTRLCDILDQLVNSIYEKKVNFTKGNALVK